MRREIKATPAKQPIDLRVVVTNAAGDVRRVEGRLATTFEHVVRFDNHAFTDSARLETLFRTIAASAAFPGVFAPVSLTFEHRVVPAFDGGAVNNTPIRHALHGAPEIDRVFVITPFPRVLSGPPPMRGLMYLSHLADILIEERLFRDLQEADQQSRALARIDALPLTRHERDSVLAALNWGGRRQVQLIEVRPDDALEGDAFRGFLSRRLRADYLAAGRRAGERIVEQNALRPAPEGTTGNHVTTR
jgi:hypothetical protein